MAGVSEGCAITYFQSLSAAGFAATAISYGPGRMGFGLFVPEISATFSMSSTMVGLVSSLGFLGFFIALMIAQALLSRQGPGVPVLSGLGAATAGMGIVALAPNVPVLAVGVFLAASSAGFAWTPFNDAVHRKIRDVDRPAAFSEISTGTSVGIALAGLSALVVALTGLSWRWCWAFFSLAAAAAFVANRMSLRSVEKASDAVPEVRWRDLFQGAAAPLFAIGFVYGATSAIYISFAANHIRESGGVPGVSAAATPALVFICFGLFGLVGLLTGRLKGRFGLAWLVRLVMLSGAGSVILVAALPDSWAGLIGSAGLQGMHVMVTSAILAFWSERLFPHLPALSFTAALLASAAGSVLGPAAAGAAIDAFGAQAMFFGAAVLPVALLIVLRDRHVRDAPVPMGAAGSF
ncbi:Predicted arabinose efflux permease, MFS family [Salinihabitans flavidus]|uniref:Predicted arabinose efflux permease, MFS family n=1 Tax=Salinihabitans flavidus TaxID=569882 RepID=A0A1H8U398_9RHOB|nr:MFS transporter [Salinihabitans flavidus]SEO97641.1 Predicted arabinose efflux permease, MFS family [Salinihabitans flavidus]